MAQLVRSGQLDLPLPGGGATWRRWSALAELAADDLCVARLAEAHVDALAILAELGVHQDPVADPSDTGTLWAVWAAEPPDNVLRARRVNSGDWVLDGTKAWCSGVHDVDRALVTAVADDGRRLFALDLGEPGVMRRRGGPSVGMSRADTGSVELHHARAEPLGAPMAYLQRPGFSHGGAAVAACWYGGAVGLGRTLLAAGRSGRDDPHRDAHLGVVDGLLESARVLLHSAADEVDADPTDSGGQAWMRTLRVRTVVDRTVEQVVTHVARAVGPTPAAGDPRYANLIADLPVYVRQCHAERDLASLGRLLLHRDPSW